MSTNTIISGIAMFAPLLLDIVGIALFSAKKKEE